MFTIVLDPRAVEDIQESISYYEYQQPDLGKRFESHVDEHLLLLTENPFFQIRYDSVRCLPLATFPHMIHYTVEEENKQVVIHAIFHTSRNPERWKKRGE